MDLAHRLPSSWKSLKLNKSLISSRCSLLRALAAILLLLHFVYVIWLPFAYLLGAFHHGWAVKNLPDLPEPGEEQVSLPLTTSNT
jgi:hypothetical protein